MNPKQIGEFLYHFYCERASSFLVNIYKASITGGLRDIHRARLDVKKLYALLGLFEILDPGSFSSARERQLFKPVHKTAGLIREIQVTYLLLTRANLPAPVRSAFTTWLRETEKRHVARFVSLVRSFRGADLMLLDVRVCRICLGSSNFRLRSRTLQYLRVQAENIRGLLKAGPEEDDIHRIRKSLKNMAIITTLVYSVRPGKQLDAIMSELNKTDMMLGDWHDRVVLISAIDRFLAEKHHGTDQDFSPLDKLKLSLIAENREMLEQVLPEVRAGLDAAFSHERNRLPGAFQHG